MIDLFIRGADVYDGSGAPPRLADVAVDAGRIVEVGKISGRSRRTIEAAGLALAPGFIDMHSHADLTLPGHGGARNSLMQGVTTEVVGNCGFSAAPVHDDRLAEYARWIHGLGPNLDWTWRTFAGYLDHLETRGVGVNIVPLVGHAALRVAAMGFDDRQPTPLELATMREELRRALLDGAWGLSTGLVYPPGAYARTPELAALADELRLANRLLASHIRGETDAVMTSIDEVIDIAERAGITLQISHLKAAGRQNWGRLPDAIGRIDRARERGASVWCDFYPYTAGSTLLSQLLPLWVHDGGAEALVERLRVPALRLRIRSELEHGLPGWSNYLASAGGWDKIVVGGVADPGLRAFEGRNLAEAARTSGADPFDLCCDILVGDRGATQMIIFMMGEDDVRAVASYANAAVGSDSLGLTSDDARVHPRVFGTFARMLGWAVRDAKVVTLQEAIRRMSGLPAQILRLPDRGRIQPGGVADLVLFDPARVRDRATYADPNRYAEGVEHVIVNGAFAVDAGTYVGTRAGRVLRRS